ncbi:exonuclease SbcCD subunit D [Bacillota bacterium Lsc_1132]
MIRLLYIGDLHIRGTNPRNRLDDYKEALIAKLREVYQMAKRHDVKAILCAGDIFDRPEVSTGVLLEFADVFAESPVPIYTTPGNHDIYGYNLSTYWRTSLALLERLVPQLTVVQDRNDFIALRGGGEVNVAVSFSPFDSQIDRDGFGYSPGTEPPSDYFKVHVAHGMLLDHTPPFDRFTLVQDVQTTADLVLTGHDHIGYGIYERFDGKVFVNCGSLTRLAASVGEMERDIQALLITIGSNKQKKLQLIKLESAKPGSEILDRSKIEAEAKRQYAMEQFSALIQTQTGEAVLLDIDSIVEQIADAEGLKADVVKIALQKINEAKATI